MFMLSIVVCSKNKTLSKDLVENIANTVGVSYEIITIDNSENKYSIFSAYNLGFTKSKYKYICFVHEDVYFHSLNWGKKVTAHLQDPHTGIIGLAGGDLVSRVPAAWSGFLSQSKNIIQSDRTGKKPTKINHLPENYNQSQRPVILLDGVFLCMRRELFEIIHFDEKMNGFHGYDFDISIQSIVKGFANYVIYDMELEHYSRGKTDAVYYRNLISVYKKWGSFLPLFLKDITQEQLTEIQKIEENNLFRLIKKMARKGFKYKEIKNEAHYYSNIIDSKKGINLLELRIFFIRLFNSPKYLFK
jgi:hypothetical protein